MKFEYFKLLVDKDWWLNNFYWIIDKEGKLICFRMMLEQWEYFEGIYICNIILKVCQFGFIIEVCIIQFDVVLFELVKCVLIVYMLNDVKCLFWEKVKYVYDKLLVEIKVVNLVSNDLVGELVFKKGGLFYVSILFCGGMLCYLYVFEFGKICVKYLDKVCEIVIGVFEVVLIGCFVIIESIVEGRVGYFFDYC